jgi:hypothetical protein
VRSDLRARARGVGRPDRLGARRRGRRLLARLHLPEGSGDRGRASRPRSTALARPADGRRRIRADRLGRRVRARGPPPVGVARAARTGRGRRLHGQSDRAQSWHRAAARRLRARHRDPQQLQRRIAGHQPALRRVVPPLRLVAGHPDPGHRPHAALPLHRREPVGVERQLHDRARRPGAAARHPGARRPHRGGRSAPDGDG